MHSAEPATVVIIDLGMGNLYSIARACEVVGLNAVITDDARLIASAEGIILPGVGAFGHAMQAITKADLYQVLVDFHASGRPLLGICLGMQLMLEVSEEYGQHQGLGFIKGSVKGLKPGVDAKLPHIGWSPIYRHTRQADWNDTLLNQFSENDYQYFLHSYYVDVQDQSDILASSRYAGFSFPAVLRRGNVSACQFHPERSGSAGLMIYRQWASQHGLQVQVNDTTGAATPLHHSQCSG